MNGFGSNGFGNLFRWHLRRELPKLLIFLAFSSLFTALVVFISDSLMPADVQEFMQKLPEAVQRMAGMTVEAQLTESFWITLLFEHPIILFLLLALPITGALKGLNSGIQDGTLEPVLAQPVSRSTYFCSLALLLAIACVLLAFGTAMGAYTSAQIFYPGKVELGFALQLGLSAAALSFAVSGLSLLCSAAPIRSGLWIMGILITFLIFRFLSGFWDAAEWLKWAGFFGYYSPREVYTGEFPWARFVSLMVIAIGLHVAAWRVFLKRPLTF